MKTSTTGKLLLGMTLLAAMTTGCLARSEVMDSASIDSYEQAMQQFSGDESRTEEGVSEFARAFADLTAPETGERFENLYADTLYFNDTLQTFHNREDLVDYIVRTGASLRESRVEIKHVIQDGPDVYVRWIMEFRTRVAGRDIHSHSIGMTHLRFNADGRIVLHQDFWDSGHALYAHLPFVGFAVRKARDRMK